MKALTTLTAAVALLGGASAVQAADVYSSGGGLKDGTSVTSPSYNWTGVYIGGFLGMHANDSTLNYSSLLTFDGIGSQGVMGGGEVGFDWQVGGPSGKIVVGAFGRGDFPTAETKLSLGGVTLKDSMNYMWTAGGRGGVLVSPSTLIFAELGYSQAEYEFSFPGFSWKRTPGGLTAGGGIETQLGGGFSAKLVYDWTGLDSVATPIPGLSVTTDVQRVAAGIDYKLNVGRLPLN